MSDQKHDIEFIGGTSHLIRLSEMEPDDALADAAINRETQDFLWEIFINSDECERLFSKLMSDGALLNSDINRSSLSDVIVNAKISGAMLKAVRSEMIEQLEDL